MGRSPEVLKVARTILLPVLIGAAAATAADRLIIHQIEQNPKTPGGLWVSPKEGESVKIVHFEARAYPTRRNIDPDVKLVEFTVSWEGKPGPWVVACREEKPKSDDHYACDWDPKKSTEIVPNGKLNVSFDVFDAKGNVNQSPNGIHSIIYQSK